MELSIETVEDGEVEEGEAKKPDVLSDQAEGNVLARECFAEEKRLAGPFDAAVVAHRADLDARVVGHGRERPGKGPRARHVESRRRVVIKGLVRSEIVVDASKAVE